MRNSLLPLRDTNDSLNLMALNETHLTRNNARAINITDEIRWNSDNFCLYLRQCILYIIKEYISLAIEHAYIYFLNIRCGEYIDVEKYICISVSTWNKYSLCSVIRALKSQLLIIIF